MAEKKYVDVHTARRLYPVQPDPECPNKGDIVEYAWKQKVTKVGEGLDDYLVSEEPVEVARYNRHEFIQKDADQVGVLNILEKVRRSGDMTLLNQTGALIPDGLQDYTNVPSSVGEALKALESGANSFAGLQAIFGDISFDQLAQMSAEQIQAKLNEYLAANTQTEVNANEQ